MTFRLTPWRIKVSAIFIFCVIGFLIYPLQEVTYDYSTVLNDRNGNLLGATIADDGQWRFPPPDSIPKKVASCLQYFEDRHFYDHPGVDPLALGRAILQNLRAGKVVSGASTLTMQISRMMRNRERTLWQKFIEIGMAVKLDFIYSKKELMIKYASMAPFGGNVVGIEAASWRYFNRPSHLLSWGEAASLAVLPNNPGAIFPGRSTKKYLEKRNRLLQVLWKNHVIDTTMYQLSIQEKLPGTPFPIPQKATHLLSKFHSERKGEIILSTIDPEWQSQGSKILERHHQLQKANGVENAALIAIDLKSSEVIAYIGNTQDHSVAGHQVDIIQKPRSPGSSLKPLLYAKSLSSGQILPHTLLPDIPTFFGGFSPKNFSREYAGAVPASQALIRSLNIPFTYLLRDYTYEQFHLDLKKSGFSTINQPPDHYGLSMILGGGEVTLWDLSNAYLNMYQQLAGLSSTSLKMTQSINKRKSNDLEPAAIWYTFQAMTELQRPFGEENWKSYSSSQIISWKTGTSFGFRDAWAIGLNGTTLIGVWVGNADGEGRAGLTGVGAAAPLLLEAMRRSDYEPNWLEKLKPEMIVKKVCTLSGKLASNMCPSKSMEVPSNSEKSGICEYHKAIHVDQTRQFQVNSSCYSLAKSAADTLFLLPPVQGHFYKKKHPDYQGSLPVHPDCQNTSLENPIEIIYPNEHSKVYIPRELDGEYGKAIFNATHHDPTATLFWSIGDIFYGKTINNHQIEINLQKGPHLLKVMDTKGNIMVRNFEVLNDNE